MRRCARWSPRRRGFGRLDILIANAAATAFKPLLETKPHNLARTFNLSVGGFVAAVQEASKHMGDGGRIVMISGIDSVRHLPGHGVLGAAKAALESMVRDFAFELGPRGITVNGSRRLYRYRLGPLLFVISRRLLRSFQPPCAERSALKRLPTLEEIAAVACLMSARSELSTAQTIMVDGGFTLSFPAAK